MLASHIKPLAMRWRVHVGAAVDNGGDGRDRATLPSDGAWPGSDLYAEESDHGEEATEGDDEEPEDKNEDSETEHEESETESEESEEEDEGYGPLADVYAEFPALVVAPSGQSAQAGRGVFVRPGYALEPGDALPIVGSCVPFLSEDELLVSRYVVAVPGRLVDGDPSHEPYGGVGHRGLAVWALINEPSRTKPNCIFFGALVVVTKPLAAGDELLISYGPDYVRDYPVSRFVWTFQDYPHLRPLF